MCILLLVVFGQTSYFLVLLSNHLWFITVFSAVSGVELAMAKEHHKCKIAIFEHTFWLVLFKKEI